MSFTSWAETTVSALARRASHGEQGPRKLSVVNPSVLLAEVGTRDKDSILLPLFLPRSGQP